MARPYRQVLRLSPLEQRIRDRRNDVFWALHDASATGVGNTDQVVLTLDVAQAAAVRLEKAAKLAAGLVELVRQREALPAEESTPWIVVSSVHVSSASGFVWQCLRCGSTREHGLPASPEVYLASGRAFIEAHRGCKELVKQREVSNG